MEQNEVDRLKMALVDLLAACKEMYAAIKDYEMEVDESPPYKHKVMVSRAYAAIEKAQQLAAAACEPHPP